MRIAAIISEYNPFHNGHKYQIDRIRDIYGSDTAIIALMSGNFTQRGELAIADKSVRAKAAVDCGVNLVLELPFPYSMSSAEFFASAGVHILQRLGILDYLAFGSEIGDIDELVKIASAMLSREYTEALSEIEESNRSFGYPELCEAAYEKCFGGSLAKDMFSPNNILALEYIKALIKEGSEISPVTIKREGAGYSDDLTIGTTLQSATAIRGLIEKEDESAFDYIPKNAISSYKSALSAGQMPTDTSLLDLSVISYFRLNSAVSDVDFHDAAGGLYNRLCDLSAKTTSISALTNLATTKKYTAARIRRALWFSYFGVTSSEIRMPPAYTQVLAMDDIGCQLLKEIKKASDFPVITKPASYREFSDDVIRQMERSVRADSVFALARKKAFRGGYSLTFTPYVKKR